MKFSSVYSLSPVSDRQGIDLLQLYDFPRDMLYGKEKIFPINWKHNKRQWWAVRFEFLGICFNNLPFSFCLSIFTYTRILDKWFVYECVI